MSWTNLKKLDLNSNEIGVAGAKELSQNTSWVNLEELSLNNNNHLNEEGKDALRSAPNWPKMKKLSFASFYSWS